MRRRLLAVILLLVAPLSTAAVGQNAPFHAGIVRFRTATATPFDVLVWYPTETNCQWPAGPFTIPASRDVAIAPGRCPIVLLSHRGGTTGGTPLILRELSAALARRRFVVVAPFHGKAGLQARPLQVRPALDAVPADTRFTSHVDPARPGMLGFSLGTAVTLELAGAVPNMAHLVAFCGVHPDDAMACHHSPDGKAVPTPGQILAAAQSPPPSPLPLKAIVLLDAFAVLFQREELTNVTMPVLMFRPERSELPGEVNTFGLAATLPHTPQVQMVPGGHFIFQSALSTARWLAATSPTGHITASQL